MQTSVATFSHVASYGKLCREMSAAGATPMLLLAWLTAWLQRLQALHLACSSKLLITHIYTN
jgi:hypothetical protein